MEFCDDDNPSERELKLKICDIYNAKLDERETRKRFVLERGLLDYRKYQVFCGGIESLWVRQDNDNDNDSDSDKYKDKG
jgi:hypothetical protein